MKIANQILMELSVQDSVRKHFAKDVKFEKADPNHAVCSIGFSETKQKWVGFSHRAMCEFGVGDKLFDPKWNPDNLSEEEMDKVKFVDRGSITIKNMNQAREAAKNFAGYVS